MGVTTSKVRDIKVTGESHIANSEMASRVLNVDPRSPTVEIVRTPIQVEQTPDQNPRRLLYGIKDPIVTSLDDVFTKERDVTVKKPAEREVEDSGTENDAMKRFL